MSQKCVVSLESRFTVPCQILRPQVFEEEMTRVCMGTEVWNFRLKLGGQHNISNAGTSPYVWALLPMDENLLDSIINLDFTLEEPIETLYMDKDLFEYTFVPLPGMEGTIARLDGSDGLPHEHLFPYTTLPVLRLHVHPHYVMVDLYQKIMKHEHFIRRIDKDKGYRPYYLKYFESDLSCRCAYRMWERWDVPPDFILNPSSNAQTLSSGEQLKLRPGAFAWDVDEVGLGPADSATYILDREDGEDSSDDQDEYIVDEADSVFQARMRRWVSEIQPGLIPLDFQEKQADAIKVDVAEVMEDMSDMDTRSSTRVIDSSPSAHKCNSGRKRIPQRRRSSRDKFNGQSRRRRRGV